MAANTAVVDRRRVQLMSVNADDLLNRLMGLGVAREMPNRPGIRRSVLFDCDPSATTGEWLDLVEFHGLRYIDPSAPPPEIAEEDIGAVCSMAVLPPQTEKSD